MTSLSPGEPAPYKTAIDDAGSGVTYIGFADPGTDTSAAAWRIQRLTESGNDLTVEWADGNTAFDNVWDDRATLAYS